MKQKFYTSYFANARNIDQEKYELVSIALYPPRWFSGRRDLSLAPTKEIFTVAKDGDFAEYEKLFKSRMTKTIDAAEILERYSKIKKDIVFLCFEKDREMCHRKMVADFLTKKGVEVREL